MVFGRRTVQDHPAVRGASLEPPHAFGRISGQGPNIPGTGRSREFRNADGCPGFHPRGARRRYPHAAGRPAPMCLAEPGGVARIGIEPKPAPKYKVPPPGPLRRARTGPPPADRFYNDRDRVRGIFSPQWLLVRDLNPLHLCPRTVLYPIELTKTVPIVVFVRIHVRYTPAGLPYFHKRNPINGERAAGPDTIRRCFLYQ